MWRTYIYFQGKTAEWNTNITTVLVVGRTYEWYHINIRGCHVNTNKSCFLINFYRKKFISVNSSCHEFIYHFEHVQISTYTISVTWLFLFLTKLPPNELQRSLFIIHIGMCFEYVSFRNKSCLFVANALFSSWGNFKVWAFQLFGFGLFWDCVFETLSLCLILDYWIKFRSVGSAE